MVLCRKNGFGGEVHGAEEQADSVEKRAEDSLHTLVPDAAAACLLNQTVKFEKEIDIIDLVFYARLDSPFSRQNCLCCQSTA